MAKQAPKDYRPDNDLFPSHHIPKPQEAARDKYAGDIEALKQHYAARKNASPKVESARA